MSRSTRTGLIAGLAALLLMPLLTLDLSAQSRYTDAGATNKFSIGPSVLPGISVPIGTLDDEDEAGLGFAVRLGIDITYPLSTDLSMLLGTGLDIRNLGVREDSLLDPRFGSVQYFYVEPGISYSSIALSLNVGVPMSGTEPVARAVGFDGDLDATNDIDSENLEMLLEPRLTGNLVLMDEKAYWLGLKVGVGLPLNDLYKEAFQRAEEFDDGRTLVGSTSPLSAHLGVTFQFGLFDAF